MKRNVTNLHLAHGGDYGSWMPDPVCSSMVGGLMRLGAARILVGRT